jgi:MFS family permease
MTLLKNFKDLPGASLRLLLARTVSGLGSALTAFALDIWIFEKTGSYTVFALLAVVVALPSLVFAPFAGYLVDRYPYKTLLLSCEAMSALAIAAIAVLTEADQLNVVAIGAAGLVLGLANTVAWPAAFASLTVLTPDEKRPAVNGVAEMLSGGAAIVGPIAGALLLAVLGLRGVLLLDIVSYSAGILLLLSISFPTPVRQAAVEKQAGGGLRPFLRDVSLGFRWIGAHPGLRLLLLLFMLINIGCSIFVVALPPYLLAVASSQVLGWCLALIGAGMVGGGMLFAMAGGFKRPETGVLIGAFCIGLCVLVFGLARAPIALCVCAVLYGASVPLANASSQTIWQSAVPIELQGRVYAVRRMIAWGLNPLSILISIPLAQSVFGQLLAARVGPWQLALWWGSGAHGALGLMISTCGVLCVLMVAGLALTGRLNVRSSVAA